MIALHAGGTPPLYFDPAKIVCLQRDPDQEKDRTAVWTVEAKEPAYVDETPDQIMRLKQAWGCRHDCQTPDEILWVAFDGEQIIAHRTDIPRDL